jgi:hypothetical protein
VLYRAHRALSVSCQACALKKHVLSESELKTVCLAALKTARLPVDAVDVVGVGRPGARANWELRALVREPDLQTAEAAFEIIAELQGSFDLPAGMARRARCWARIF